MDEESARRSVITGILIVFGLLALFIIAIFVTADKRDKETVENEKVSDAYYSKYNIRLKGIIDKKIKINDPTESRSSIYTIKIAKCNIKEHDIRSYNEDYYLVVMGDSAKMVDANYVFEVNDSVFIDYTKQERVSWNKFGYEKGKLPSLSIYYNSTRRAGLGR